MEPFLGMTAIFGFNFAPRGWAQCNGQLLPINQNQALYALLGTMYGGDGRTTFALPDLRGRTSIGFGTGAGLTNRTQGQISGTESVTLNQTEMPVHNHLMTASSDAPTTANVSGNSLASEQRGGATMAPIYVPGATNQVAMGSATTQAGGGQAHSNLQPYLAVNICIALQGVFPSRN